MSTLSTVKQLLTKQPALTYGSVRSYIFHEDTNGLKKSGAVLRIGRKVMIDDEKFMEWIVAQNSGVQ